MAVAARNGGEGKEIMPTVKQPVPWTKLSQIPDGAWFRRIGEDAVVGRQRPWVQITAFYRPLPASQDQASGREIPAEPAAVEMDGSYVTLTDLLGRWEWTKTPRLDNPQVSPCGVIPL